jgi:hypothetical protein
MKIPTNLNLILRGTYKDVKHKNIVPKKLCRFAFADVGILLENRYK